MTAYPPAAVNFSETNKLHNFSFGAKMPPPVENDNPDSSNGDDQFMQVMVPSSGSNIPRLFLQASKSLPHSLHSFSTIRPYEPPKSEKLRQVSSRHTFRSSLSN
eukprot:Gregarina_sp_Poly_1__2865@NODE_17_length_22522_cov_92_073614_g15_i0_p26_GENE_NODE_17_length_22522_cov_92_073614_g15_i0NODE_17_length_22522_cov_92_073614_g15_i0_p26_ORF_typecomplete_len104_score10_12Nup_retrotrp_bd/PF10599_9/0_27_NODE_17_length_22522_cov_92_073614_g15_i040624373